MKSGNLTSKGKNISETLVLDFTVSTVGKGSQEKFFTIPFNLVAEISQLFNNYEMINHLIIPDFLQTFLPLESIISFKLGTWGD